MSNRNKQAGSAYERFCAKAIGFIVNKPVRTSRLMSRDEDNHSIDLYSKDTEPFQIQCKLQTNLPDLSIFNIMEGYNDKAINVLMWGKTRRSEKNMVKQEDYAILKLKDFEALIEHYASGRHLEI
jgi:hypothetical protein